MNSSGVIYFGFPECPWCRNAVSVLLDAASETGIDKIYYMNNRDDRDIQSLKDGKISIEQAGKQEEVDWLLERWPDGKYRDVIGLCKVAKIAGEDGIEDNDWSLNAGRYCGVFFQRTQNH